jgi:ABC-type bacteriocin/lantibiotic exporter with double-glycine peptidase domain
LKVEILNLTYRYSESEDAIIKNINVTINPGEKLAIFGRSGSGKTTLIRLISGFYDDMDGNIIFNNISVRNFHKDVLRMYIGDNFGEQNVFHGTIMENLTLGNPNIELDNLFEILENLKMKDKIDSLKDGLNTIIQAEGKNFSRTFLRKIVIARSLLKRPQLLLLDDFGVYFDKIQRKQIIDYLFSLKNVTIIYCTDDDYLLKLSILFWFVGFLISMFPIVNIIFPIQSHHTIPTW